MLKRVLHETCNVHACRGFLLYLLLSFFVALRRVELRANPNATSRVSNALFAVRRALAACAASTRGKLFFHFSFFGLGFRSHLSRSVAVPRTVSTPTIFRVIFVYNEYQDFVFVKSHESPIRDLPGAPAVDRTELSSPH